MAEDKKPKIDLKARLGKVHGSGMPAATSSVPSSGRVPSAMPPHVGSSVPPPAAVLGMGMRAGSVPPPAVGVPIPPFGGQPATDAFGAPVDTRSSRTAGGGATIKVEMDAETARAAGKAGKKGAMLAIIGLALGLGLGYAFGGRSASDEGAKRALKDAEELVGDIDKAQAKVKDLTEKIGGAIKSLKDKKFPDAFAAELGGLSIPFGSDKIAGRNIGRFNAKALQGLLDYTVDIEALNDRKDALKNLFISAKKPITDALAEAGNPKVAWSVFIQKSQAHGPVAVLARNNPAEAFAYKDTWPAKYKISNGNELVEVERYSTGDVFTSEKKVVTIPIEPDSVANSFPNDILTRVTSELAKTEGVLAGKATGNDEDESVGILKKGDALLVELRKIGKK
jgi:hypothetical protein